MTEPSQKLMAYIITAATAAAICRWSVLCLWGGQAGVLWLEIDPVHVL